MQSSDEGRKARYCCHDSHFPSRKVPLAAQNKGALTFSVQDAPAALPQNCQTTISMLRVSVTNCKCHFSNWDLYPRNICGMTGGLISEMRS